MEFKLLDNPEHQKKNDYAKTYSNLSANTNSYDIPTSRLSHSPNRNDYNPRSSPQDVHYRHQSNTYMQPPNNSRPLIDLEPSTLFNRRNEETDLRNVSYRGGTCYNEQPPPQPSRNIQLRPENNGTQINRTNFLILVILICVVLFIFSFLMGQDQNEVILL